MSVTLILGANGSIGHIIAEREAETSHVVGTYRKDDDVTKRLSNNPNITMIHHNFLDSSDTTHIITTARNIGTINKVYFLVGESWNMVWDNATLEDFQNAINVCALPVASLLMNLEPELSDENNFLRWASVSGMSSQIVTGGPNKPCTGGAKNLAEFYVKSAAAYWSYKKNLLNNVCTGDSQRSKNFYVGCTGKDLEEIDRNEIPLGGQAQSLDMAEFLLWLNSDKNTYMTGTNVLHDGARSIRTKHNAKDTPKRQHVDYYNR